uniref:NADH dehydrogenase subunit 4 n=1 Tax=Bankia setacea TaxID=693219 RepID=UPI002027D638|nr:NADH dehydrogenase subunit 4 [Bankia setacea]UPX89071.1 NADH dehydrogenase subunit 4 [Bankia setacea]UPX89107.1 NADH dehydrogenase subunit 4 [Bankia setacea]
MGFFVLIGMVVSSALWNVGGAGVIFGLVIAFLLVLVEFSVQPFLGFQPMEYVLLDKFSTLMVVMTLIVGVMTLLCSHNEFNVSSFSAKSGAEMSVLLTLMFSVFMFISANWMWFYMWFEASLIPMLWLILIWGYQPERFEAAMFMTLYTVGGSLPLLVVLVYFMSSCGTDCFLVAKLSYEFWVCGTSLSGIFVLALIFGFLVKAPLFGVHGWLPKAHVEAPLAGSMLLSGVLLKLGGYGLYRVTWLVDLKSGGGWLIVYVVMSLSLIGGCLCTGICACQSDLKSMVAFSSVGHMGFCICGLLSGTSIGIGGAASVMFAHGICSPLLFALSGALYDGSETRSVGVNLGVDMASPGFSLVWAVSWFVNMGVPMTLNYLGEWMLIGSMKLVVPALLGFVWLSCFLNGVVSFYAFSTVCHGVLSEYSRSNGMQINERYYISCTFGLLFLFFSPFALDFFTA